MYTPAYFLTWTTYGTWLPGDSRGWVNRHRTHGEIIEPPNPKLQAAAKSRMAADQVMLDQQLRKTVHDAILETAGHFGWSIHALEVRSNHVHVIITAPEKSPGEVMRSLKAYSSRSLSSMDNRGRVKWWTRQGSKKILFTGKALAAAIQYVENQDTSWMKGF